MDPFYVRIVVLTVFSITVLVHLNALPQYKKLTLPSPIKARLRHISILMVVISSLHIAILIELMINDDLVAKKTVHWPWAMYSMSIAVTFILMGRLPKLAKSITDEKP